MYNDTRLLNDFFKEGVRLNLDNNEVKKNWRKDVKEIRERSNDEKIKVWHQMDSDIKVVNSIPICSCLGLFNGHGEESNEHNLNFFSSIRVNSIGEDSGLVYVGYMWISLT